MQAISPRVRGSSSSAGAGGEGDEDVDGRERGIIVSNSLSTVSMNLDHIQPLAEATTEISSGISLPIPRTIPAAYFEDVPSLLASPFELSVPSSIEPEVQTPSILSTETQLVDSTNFAPPSQAQIIMAQIKSAGFDHFHQAWPLLHVPTFTAEKTSALLMSALSNLSMWMQDGNRHHLVPDEINQQLTRALMMRTVSMVAVVLIRDTEDSARQRKY